MKTIKKESFKERLFKTFDFKFQAFIFSIVLFVCVFYDAFKIPTSDKKLVPFSIISLVAGVVFEGVRLTEKKMTILYLVVGSLIGSFFLTIHSNYNFEEGAQIWPYTFILVFSFFSVILHDKKLVLKLTEGITLIQSIAIIYWIVDNGFLLEYGFLATLALVIALLFSLFSAYHALAYRAITERTRLILSIWSSVIMILFAFDNAVRVFYLEQIEEAASFFDKFYIGMAYFFLGVSTIYIVKNIQMLLGFLPDRNIKYSVHYKKMRNKHIARYSDQQASQSHSVLCLLFSTTFFLLNYFFHFCDGHIAIWVVFVSFPYIIIFYDFIRKSGEDKAVSK